MTVFNRRELRKIVGIDGEELTLDLLPVSSIRIHSKMTLMESGKSS